VAERLPWHEPLWRQLQLRVANRRLPHALLLTGRLGLGKLIFARRLAQALLCEKRDEGGDACGRCRGCRLLQAGSHPDFNVLRSAEESKVIKVDQIRELRNFLSFTPQYGGYKIALLESADSLNLNAANSLLKTLEEPPGDSLLVLVSAQAARLPATVRGRCQALRFERPPAHQARAWLASRISSELEPQTLLAAAAGAPLAALALADLARWNRRRHLIENYEQLTAGKVDPIQAAAVWLQGDLGENLRWLIGWHTDLIRLKMSSEPPWLGNPDLRPRLQHWADRWTPRALFARLDGAVRLHVLCSTTQVNSQLLLEAFFNDSAAGSESAGFQSAL